MMKSVAIVALSWVIVTSSARAETDIATDEWLSLMKSHGFDFYIRKKDIQREQLPGKRLVWSLAMKDGQKSYMTRFNVNCDDQTIKSEYRSLYMPDGTVAGYEMPNAERQPATPGTLGGMIVDLVC